MKAVLLLALAAAMIACGCEGIPISDREAKRRGIPTGKPFDVEAAAAKASRAMELIEAGRFAEARAGIQFALDLATDLKSTGHKEIQRAIPVLHYGLACIDALASVGKSGPGDIPKTVPAIRESSLREQALEHLRKAVRSGFRDFDHARRDPALAPIRSLPGFEAALKKPPGRGGLSGDSGW
jgi:hypothetical protein